MLFTCGARAPATDHGAMRRVARGPEALTVDIHCHVFSKAADAMTRELFTIDKAPSLLYANEHAREINRRQDVDIGPKLTSVEVRLDDMDRMGIDVQAISPAPMQYYYWTEPDLGREVARTINDELAGIAQSNAERFVALGTVPLQQPELAVAELERCVDELGMRGVEISSNVDGRDLTEAGLEKFFAKAEALDVLIFLHPLGFTEGRRLTEHYFNNVIGNPLESTIAVAHLIFGGVLDRYPGLKICVAHGGGYLPSYAGRMDHAHRARADCRLHIEAPPTRYLRKLYFDSIVFAPEQLAYLVEQYGADHVLLGSDYPFDMGEPDPVGFVEGVSAMSEAEKRAVLGLNAARLLKITR